MALEGVVTGIKVNGKPINNIRYADDTEILTSNPGDLQDILDRVTEVGEQFSLSLNITTTKLVIGRQELNNINHTINGDAVERVSTFNYLGATFNEKCDCDEEVKIRLGTATTTYLLENEKYTFPENATVPPSIADNQVLYMAYLVIWSGDMVTQ
ncbi:uncharacterized protein LOC125504356, partial [Dendroctonus ponderosae]|uniref:uncharacterized protein LOC125504353 n=1 Tax=Dendroctonus ponderosae TaxID=77166 RepID=UPI0020355B9D